MVGLLRLLVILWPLTEILVLILVADEIGAGWTFLALLGAGLAGIAVIRVLGAASLIELQGALARQEPPTGALVRGACVLLAGMLLIVPGFLSDAVALLLLVPPLRAGVLGLVWRRWPRPGGGPGRGPGPGPGMGGGMGSGMGRGPYGRSGGPVIIDGDYQEVPPDRERVEPPPSDAPPTPDRTRAP